MGQGPLIFQMAQGCHGLTPAKPGRARKPPFPVVLVQGAVINDHQSSSLAMALAVAS